CNLGGFALRVSLCRHLTGLPLVIRVRQLSTALSFLECALPMQIDSSTPRRSYATCNGARPVKTRFWDHIPYPSALKRQSEPEICEPLRHHPGVFRVDVLVVKVLVEQVVDAQRKHAAPLRQPKPKRRVGRPEGVLAGLGDPAERYEQALLMVVRDAQACVESRAAEVARFERQAAQLHLREVVGRKLVRGEVADVVARTEAQHRQRSPIKIGAGALLLPRPT